MIHCRSAAADFLELIVAHRNLLPEKPGVMHFYTDSPDIARKLLDLGFYFTFGGVITFVRQYDALINLIPTNRLLTETDCPYVSPAPYRGERNEPSRIPLILQSLADVRGSSPALIANSVLTNTQEVFSLTDIA
jgi:TatD DNase family protein